MKNVMSISSKKFLLNVSVQNHAHINYVWTQFHLLIFKWIVESLKISTLSPQLICLQNLVFCRKMHEPAHKADYERAQKEKDYFFDVEVSI